MIKYKLHFATSVDDSQSGDTLNIKLDRGHPCYVVNGNCLNIKLIEVCVYGSPESGQFRIVGTELNQQSSFVDEGIITEEPSDAEDPGRFLGWKREVSATGARTLRLNFQAPKSDGREHDWELTAATTPPPVVKIKIRRQEVSC